MKSLIVMAIGSLLAACTPPPNTRMYEPIAQHTVKAGETDSDVVWVQRFDSTASQTKLLRCSGTPQGPRCDEAKLP